MHPTTTAPAGTPIDRSFVPPRVPDPTLRVGAAPLGQPRGPGGRAALAQGRRSTIRRSSTSADLEYSSRFYTHGVSWVGSAFGIGVQGAGLSGVTIEGVPPGPFHPGLPAYAAEIANDGRTHRPAFLRKALPGPAPACPPARRRASCTASTRAQPPVHRPSFILR